MFGKLLLAIIFCSFAVSVHAEESKMAVVRVDGSTTVTNAVFAPHQKDIEQAAGVTVEIYPTSSGKGVEALLAGRTDVAMISTDLAEILAKLKSEGIGGQAALKETEIGRSQVMFIVNPSVSVRRLTADQLKGIFGGKITNWKEVGGSDSAISVYVESAEGAMRTLIEDKLLHGPVPDSLTATKRATDLPGFVARTPDSIGFVSSALAAERRAGTVTVDTDAQLIQRLVLVTKPDVAAEVQKVVVAAEKVAHDKP